MGMINVELRSCDDWEALYINNIKVAENHHLSGIDILKVLDRNKIFEVNYKDFEGDEYNDEEIKEFFPENL